jgi:hypothetical protein
MPTALTFIVPVRHPENAKDWNRQKQNLADTVRSISSQLCNDWNAVVVANHGSDLPPLPARIDVKWVDFLPNMMHERGNADRENFYDAFRADKGRRVLAGMLHAGSMGHVMIVDDDDFVSNRLASFVANHRASAGWFLSEGFAWNDGGKLLYRLSDFHQRCGTSHIVRSDLYAIPKNMGQASEGYVRRMLGSHVFIDGYLEVSGDPLNPALRKKVEKCAYYAAFWKATNSVRVAASRCAFSSR